MSRIQDISLPIGGDLLVWPGDPPVEVLRRKHLATDGSNVSEIRMGTHTGTHVDPPLHFLEGGEGVDRVPLDVLVGPALVVELPGMLGAISAEDLETAGVPAGTERLLLKTGNSALWDDARPAFPQAYAHLTPVSAGWLVARGTRLLGVDFLSVEKKGSPGHPAHVALLQGGVTIVEGLDLRVVEPGEYTLACLPLRIAGGDGGPARAVLIEP